MSSLFNSLAEISQEYTIFEKDQILTEEQLNSVTEYLDDQDRLSRIHLTGVGIVCGLQATRSGATVQLSKGVGITTDGDLVRLAGDKVFNRFKSYSEEAPQYLPFYIDATTRIDLYELVETGVTDPLALPLSSFQTTTGSNLNSMTALLLVESYVKDHDLCSGTDCDNHSQQYISTTKLLLLSNSDANNLSTALPTAKSAAMQLSPLWAERVVVAQSLNTNSEWINAFRGASNTTHSRLSNALSTLWAACGFLFSEAFAANPVAGWQTRLTALNTNFTQQSSGLQYYYAFLRDLVDCWNELLQLLHTDIHWCCPEVSGFPKHLLLGDLNNASAHRTAFYAASGNGISSSVNEAVFLLKKFGALIDNFEIPATTTVRVTPSYWRGSLQHKAIPFYYKADGSDLPRHWNFALTDQGREQHNYGYRAASYSALGAAAAPLSASLQGFDFFRVEGHIGQSFTTVLSNLETQIADNNLPFTVYGVLLEGNRDKLLGNLGAGFTDLNRFHYLARKDLVYRIQDVGQFSGNFKTGIDSAVDSGIIRNDSTSNDGATVKGIAASRNTAISEKTSQVMAKLDRGYEQYKGDATWINDISDIKSTAGQFKYDLGKVAQTQFVTPFDGFIVDPMPNWLNWLDVLIEDKDKAADDKKLFSNFIKAHPGVEPACGVIRGGTLVLVYNASGTVVGDLMLSHYLEQEVEPASEPPLVRPLPPLDVGIIPGIKFNPSLDHYLDLKLDDFKGLIDVEIQDKFDFSKMYGDVLKDSLGIVKDIYYADVSIKPGSVDVGDIKYDDNYLGMLDQSLSAQEQLVQFYDEQLSLDTLPQETRTQYESAKEQAQEVIAKDVAKAASYLVDSGKTATVGSDGYKALQTIERGSKALSGNTKAIQDVSGVLNGLQDGAVDAGVAAGFKSITLGF